MNARLIRFTQEATHSNKILSRLIDEPWGLRASKGEVGGRNSLKLTPLAFFRSVRLTPVYCWPTNTARILTLRTPV